jgi:hypothetical protein
VRGFVVITLLAASTSAFADPVRHVPPAEAISNTAVELVAEATATAPTIVAHYRTTGTTGEFAAIELVRREPDWVAVIPATAVVAPGVDYYLDVGGAPVFASAQHPHTVRVEITDDNARHGRDVQRTGDRRSRIHSAFEWVDFGARTVAMPGGGVQTFADRYYRIDADFAYRLWAYPLEEIRVGYTRLIGDTELAGVKTEAGFKVGGWFELGLAPIEGFHLDARGMVLATSAGFGVGARGEARLGDRDGSHIAIGAEYITDIGANGFFRLGWGTVPGFPMAATVEITELPDVDRSAGVRLYYDLARELGNGVRIGLRVGYAARNQAIAGFTTGVNASVDF